MTQRGMSELPGLTQNIQYVALTEPWQEGRPSTDSALWSRLRGAGRLSGVLQNASRSELRSPSRQIVSRVYGRGGRSDQVCDLVPVRWLVWDIC